MNNPLEVKRTSPLKMLAPLFVFLIIALAWSIYWYSALGAAKQRLAAFEAERLALTCRDRAWGGYPFRIYFDCAGMSVAVAGVDVTADKLRLIGQAWNLDHIIGALFGPVRIGQVSVSGDAIRFSHRTENGKLALASLLAEAQTIEFAADRRLTIAKTGAHLRPQTASGRLEVAVDLAGLSTGTAQLDSFKVTGRLEPAMLREGSFELLSEPSNYLDAVWIVQHLAGLNDAEMNAAQAIIGPLLKANDNKLPILLKEGTWYWGPFPVLEPHTPG